MNARMDCRRLARRLSERAINRLYRNKQLTPPLQVFPVSDKLYIGLSGLATDTYTLRESLRFRVNMYRMKEEREITPETFTHLVSSTLYEKR
jgi:20S proteasome alpha/beta subunit